MPQLDTIQKPKVVIRKKNSRRKRKRILDAFLFVASQSKHPSDITMLKIATTAGLSTQSIYMRYFKNVDEIIISLEQTVIEDVDKRLVQARTVHQALSPFDILAADFLPALYDQRLKYQVYFRQDIFPDLTFSLEKVLEEWLRPFLKTKIAGIHLSKDIFLHVEARFLFSIFTEWLLAEQPIPIELFQDEFLEMVQVAHLPDLIEVTFPKRDRKK